MNSFKPLLIFAVLAGIGYGVYCRVNGEPEDPPEWVNPGWEVPPDMTLNENESATETPPASLTTAAPVREDVGSAPFLADAPHQLPNASHVAPVQQQPAAGLPTEPKTTAAPPAVDPYASDHWNSRDPQPAVSQFSAKLSDVRRDLDEGRLKEGLETLSQWYFDHNLSSTDHDQLCELLDQVAGTVIYSTQHLLEPAYVATGGERLEEVAQKYNVPVELLKNINGITDSRPLEAGEELKVLRGPFDAVLSLDQRELTLWLGGHFAGRFQVGFGTDWPPQEGDFHVVKKVLRPDYRSASKTVAGDDPENPFGGYWINLDDQMGIHGTNDPQFSSRTNLPGSITLGGRDIADVFDILTVGSRVTVRR